MTILVANLSSGKGTWGHVGRLIKMQEWDRVILVTNPFGQENFKCEKPVDLVVIDERKSIRDLTNDIKSGLDKKLSSEIALNLVSGSGKEHMALLSAVMQSGVGFRMIALTKDGITEI
jgi:hypothetical protein